MNFIVELFERRGNYSSRRNNCCVHSSVNSVVTRRKKGAGYDGEGEVKGESAVVISVLSCVYPRVAPFSLRNDM